jgi:hypothetical protein
MRSWAPPGATHNPRLEVTVGKRPTQLLTRGSHSPGVPFRIDHRLFLFLGVRSMQVFILHARTLHGSFINARQYFTTEFHFKMKKYCWAAASSRYARQSTLSTVLGHKFVHTLGTTWGTLSHFETRISRFRLPSRPAKSLCCRRRKGDFANV